MCSLNSSPEWIAINAAATLASAPISPPAMLWSAISAAAGVKAAPPPPPARAPPRRGPRGRVPGRRDRAHEGEDVLARAPVQGVATAAHGGDRVLLLGRQTLLLLCMPALAVRHARDRGRPAADARARAAHHRVRGGIRRG